MSWICVGTRPSVRYIVFLLSLAASPLMYPGKSRGDEPPNLSWRRHKPFICMAEIRGSHFIRRAVAPDMLARPASPGAPPETRPFNDTGPRRARQEDTRLVSRVLTWQLCQLRQADKQCWQTHRVERERESEAKTGMVLLALLSFRFPDFPPLWPPLSFNRHGGESQGCLFFVFFF